MKKTASRSQKAKNNNQRGSVKNLLAGKGRSSQQKGLALFILVFALVASYMAIASFAAAKPTYFGNTYYWMGRVRACESGQGVWDKSDYQKVGGAYGYSDADWDNYAGVSKAEQASPEAQDAKFTADWNASNIGNTLWKDSETCWKPGGTIKKAPCLPIPVNPSKGDIPTDTTVNDANNTPDQVDTIVIEEESNTDEQVNNLDSNQRNVDGN